MKKYLFIVLSMSACSHSVHLVQTSSYGNDFVLSTSKPVSAQGEQFVFLGFVQQTNFVNQAYDSLLATCSSGQIRGISSEYWTDHGFFSWTNRVRMQGRCIVQ